MPLSDAQRAAATAAQQQAAARAKVEADARALRDSRLAALATPLDALAQTVGAPIHRPADLTARPGARLFTEVPATWHDLSQRAEDPCFFMLAGDDGDGIGLYVDVTCLRAKAPPPLVYRFSENFPPYWWLAESVDASAEVLAEDRFVLYDLVRTGARFGGRRHEAVRELLEELESNEYRQPPQTPRDASRDWLWNPHERTQAELARVAQLYADAGNLFASTHVRAQAIDAEYQASRIVF